MEAQAHLKLRSITPVACGDPFTYVSVDGFTLKLTDGTICHFDFQQCDIDYGTANGFFEVEADLSDFNPDLLTEDTEVNASQLTLEKIQGAKVANVWYECRNELDPELDPNLPLDLVELNLSLVNRGELIEFSQRVV